MAKKAGVPLVLLAALLGACESGPFAGIFAARASDLTVSLAPEYFSPDGDGENDELTITMDVHDELFSKPGGGATGWYFDILQPEFSPQAGQTFKHFEGRFPLKKIVWDGRSDPPEIRRPNSGAEPARVESMTDYPYVSTIIDGKGKALASSKGLISVDGI
jgi:hypothetical protein